MKKSLVRFMATCKSVIIKSILAINELLPTCRFFSDIGMINHSSSTCITSFIAYQLHAHAYQNNMCPTVSIVVGEGRESFV